MSHIYALKARVVQVCLAVGIRQEQVAEAAGYERTLFSRYLNGRRRPPPDFAARVDATLDRLEAAEQAADAARQRVLAEMATDATEAA